MFKIRKHILFSESEYDSYATQLIIIIFISSSDKRQILFKHFHHTRFFISIFCDTLINRSGLWHDAGRSRALTVEWKCDKYYQHRIIYELVRRARATTTRVGISIRSVWFMSYLDVFGPHHIFFTLINISFYYELRIFYFYFFIFFFSNAF